MTNPFDAATIRAHCDRWNESTDSADEMRAAGREMFTLLRAQADRLDGCERLHATLWNIVEAAILNREDRRTIDLAVSTILPLVAAEVAKAERAMLERAAEVAESLSWAEDVEWWLHATKKEVGARSCHEVAAAIRALSTSALPLSDRQVATSFQTRSWTEIVECLGEARANDSDERVQRFFEEAIELVQAAGMTPSTAHQMVDWKFSGGVGLVSKEIGNVMVALAGVASVHGVDMMVAGEDDLLSIAGRHNEIRTRHEAKPRFVDRPAAAEGGPEPVAWVLEQFPQTDDEDPDEVIRSSCDDDLRVKHFRRAEAVLRVRDEGKGVGNG
jgi:hypothetical protein